jgi:DNA-binding Lrp family transcriptional regulator
VKICSRIGSGVYPKESNIIGDSPVSEHGLLVSDENKAMEVVRALSDEYSRRILVSIISRSLPIEEISREQNIPISTCYRRIHEMLLFGVIKPDRTIIREDGKKYVCYKSAVRNVTILLESGELKVDVVINKEPAERLGQLWSEVRNSSKTVAENSQSKNTVEVPPKKITPLLTV